MDNKTGTIISVEQAAKQLLLRDNILLISHRSPDGDTLGSGLGLYYALRDLGKTVSLICSDGFPEKFAFLYGDRQFQQRIEASYIVTVDLADRPLLGAANLHYGDGIDLAIDHHVSNSLYAKQVVLATEASSTCEVMMEVILALGAKLTPLISSCLYTGIITDTGCFQYPNTTPNTHLAAATLMAAGADYATINEKMFGTKTRARVEVERFIYRTLELTQNGAIAFVYIPLQLLKDTGADEFEIDGVASMPRQIEGVQVAITMREQGAETFRVSLRSSKNIDVAKLAGVFGGGGHVRAAGCSLNGSFSDCKERLLAAALATLE